MGNVILQCVKRCSNGDQSIRVMRMDGQVLRFEGPIYAEEVLCNYYPNSALLFDSQSLNRPLNGNAELQEGQLYYLIPCPGISREFLETSLASSLENTRHHKKSCLLLLRSMGGDKKQPSIEIIPCSSQDGVVRLKLLISNKELATLMSESTDAMKMVESIVTPLLLSEMAARSPKSSASRGGNVSWKPELESIPEINVTLSSS